MTTFGSENIYPSNVDKTVWKLWSDGSVFNDVNANVYPVDFIIGTGQGCIVGYDSGGFKTTPQATAGSGVFWDSGVYYIKTTSTTFANDTNRQTAVRIYADATGTINCHPFAASTTGYSFIYLDDSGTINEATGLTWSNGDAVTNTASKLLIAQIIRDGNNTIQQSDIIDRRTFVDRVHNEYSTFHCNPILRGDTSDFVISASMPPGFNYAAPTTGSVHRFSENIIMPHSPTFLKDIDIHYGVHTQPFGLISIQVFGAPYQSSGTSLTDATSRYIQILGTTNIASGSSVLYVHKVSVNRKFGFETGDLLSLGINFYLYDNTSSAASFIYRGTRANWTKL